MCSIVHLIGWYVSAVLVKNSRRISPSVLCANMSDSVFILSFRVGEERTQDVGSEREGREERGRESEKEWEKEHFHYANSSYIKKCGNSITANVRIDLFLPAPNRSLLIVWYSHLFKTKSIFTKNDNSISGCVVSRATDNCVVTVIGTKTLSSNSISDAWHCWVVYHPWLGCSWNRGPYFHTYVWQKATDWRGREKNVTRPCSTNQQAGRR